MGVSGNYKCQHLTIQNFSACENFKSFPSKKMSSRVFLGSCPQGGRLGLPRDRKALDKWSQSWDSWWRRERERLADGGWADARHEGGEWVKSQVEGFPWELMENRALCFRNSCFAGNRCREEQRERRTIFRLCLMLRMHFPFGVFSRDCSEGLGCLQFIFSYLTAVPLNTTIERRLGHEVAIFASSTGESWRGSSRAERGGVRTRTDRWLTGVGDYSYSTHRTFPVASGCQQRWLSSPTSP